MTNAAIKRGAIANGFRKISEWRGEFPVLVYVTTDGGIDAAFSDSNLGRPHDHARTICLARTRDDFPYSAAQLGKWMSREKDA